ncbi:hypothetical protein HN446_02035 [bacterium]|jgi:hypothetical protein|nr:hypothetical protein [bacterium]
MKMYITLAMLFVLVLAPSCKKEKKHAPKKHAKKIHRVVKHTPKRAHVKKHENWERRIEEDLEKDLKW